MSEKQDRRQHTRQKRDERVVVQVASSTHDTLPAGTVVRCSTKDVSPSGLRIRLDHQVPDGFLVELWVEVSNHPTKFYLAGEVMWCQELEDKKHYLIGVKLKDGETDDFKKWQEVFESNDSADLKQVRRA
jgi:Tfp pilus assembly protein PilZ